MTLPQDPGAAPPASADPRTDRELLSAHLKQDMTAFPELVTRHRQRLWNLALRTLRDREDAADAVQDATIRAFRSAHTYRGDAEVSTWLTRIVINVALTRISVRERRATVPLDDQVHDERGTDLMDTADAFAELDARHAAAQLLARLPDEQRLAIVLVDVEGHSVAEAADMLGVAPGTIKSRCARGRARLASALTTTPRAAAPHAARHSDRGGEDR